VVNERDVVLGVLRRREFESAEEATAEQSMRSGPATYRPDTLLADVLERLRARRIPGVLITRSDGTLVGWLRREDAERALQGAAK
jgi:CBS domain-containing protein